MAKFDPKLDLTIERVYDAKIETVWKALTKAEHLKKWFVPAPWTIPDCEVDLKPGGIFKLVMQSPEGQQFPNIGCFLEVIENKKLVWTDALRPGFRPSETIQSGSGVYFTAAITLEPQGSGTKYKAHVMHPTEEMRKKHEEMGFHDGWGTCLEQLGQLLPGMK